MYVVQKYELLKYLKAHEDGHSLGLFMKFYRVNVLKCPFEHVLHASLMGTDILSVVIFFVHQEHKT
jgi:hypothetical protein